MGEAKRRGTYEERKANPLGDSPKFKYWTDERLSEFKERLVKELGEDIDKIRKDLFTPRKKKVKRFKNIKTGG